MENTDDWDPLDHSGLRDRIEQGTLEEWGRVFPQTYGGVRVEAKDLRLAGKPRFTLQEQKKAWMENRMLSRSLKADLELYDSETGEQLDAKPAVTLMRVPYYTDRGNFVYNGNNFTGTTQSRMIPGAYTRRQNNGGLETQFNTRAGTGKVFRIGLDQGTGQLRLRTGGSDLHLYSVLRDAGVADDELAAAWGPAVLELNRDKYDSRALGKAFQKFVPKYEQAEVSEHPQRVGKLLEALAKAQVSRRAVDRTLASYWQPRQVKEASAVEFHAMLWQLLKGAAAPTFDVRDQGDTDDEGDEYRPVGIEGLLAASRKLLAVNQGHDQTDNRNVPGFSKLYTMDKLMRERIRLDEGKLRQNLLRMVASRRNLSPLGHRAFDPYYLEVITKHPTTNPIEETNPLQAVGQHRRVTQMGPGGIGSDDAVTSEMQMVQASEFGFFSPLEGPESLDRNTLVLSRLGWIKAPEVTAEHELACCIDGRLEFLRPIKVHQHPFKDEMIGVKSLYVDFLVTPNHRIWYRDTDSRNKLGKPWQMGFAQDLFNKQINLAMAHAPHLRVGDAFFIGIPGMKLPMVVWCRLLAYWLADGSCGSGNQSVITHAQNRPAYPGICEVLQTLQIPWEYRLRGWTANEDTGDFFITCKALREYLRDFGKSGTKFIPEFVFEQSIAAREAFLQALMETDCRINKTHRSFVSTSKEFARGVERLMISLGRAVSFREEPDTRERVTSTNWVVSDLKNRERQTRTAYNPDAWYRQEYDDDVFCVTVPGGMIFTRRGNGYGHWTGNSSRAGVDVRLAWGSRIGKDGRVRRPLRNLRTGATEMVSPEDLFGKTLKLPD